MHNEKTPFITNFLIVEAFVIAAAYLALAIVAASSELVMLEVAAGVISIIALVLFVSFVINKRKNS